MTIRRFVAVAILAIGPPVLADNAVRLATDGTGFAATWRDQGTGRLLVQRLGSKGIAIAEPQIVADAASDHAIAFGSSSYLIAWSAGDSLFVRRMAANGTFIDGMPRLIAQTIAPHPAIAWNGSAWLIAWTTQEKTASGIWTSGISTIFLTPDGIATSPSSMAADNQYEYLSPRLAWNGSEFVVAWLRRWRCVTTSCTPSVAIEWIRLAPSGVPLNGRTRTEDNLSPSMVSFGMATDGDATVFTFDHPTGISIIRAGPASPTDRSLSKIFSWFTQPQSDVVVVDGGIVVAARYGTDVPAITPTPARRQWLTLIKVARDLTVTSRTVMRLGDDVLLDQPMLAVNSAASLIVAVPSLAGSEVHREEEMHTPAPPPQQPTLRAAAAYGPIAYLSWISDGANIDGFIVYRWHYFYAVWTDVVGLAAPDARSAEVAATFTGSYKGPDLAIVVAFNEGGESQWSNLLHPAAVTRKRAAPHR